MRECERCARPFHGCAGDDELHHILGKCALQHLLTVGIVAVVREIDAYVDEFGGHDVGGIEDNSVRAAHSAATSSSGWFQETTSLASPEPAAPQS